MSSGTREETSIETIPDWATGYALILPCGYRACENEAEWFGNQHGCIKANICDYHMQKCYADAKRKLATWGTVQCRQCNLEFPTFASFIKAVRI